MKLEVLESREIVRMAHFDESRRFRYILKRQFVGKRAPLRLCVWMNPSDADDVKDDPSIRIGMSFARKWGDGGILVVNVMDLVCTDSKKLPENRKEALGPLHWTYVDVAIACGYGDVHKEVMCGWGDAGAGDLAFRMQLRLIGNGLIPCALALTKSGNPGHPLRKSLELPLVPMPNIIPPARHRPYELEA